MDNVNGIDMLKIAVSNIIAQNPQGKILKMKEGDREKLHFDLMLNIAKTDPIAFVLHHDGIREFLFHYMHLVAFDDEDD